MAGRTRGTVQKALLPVAGRPFIDFKLEQLAAAGARQVVLLLGHGADAVVDHVGDGGRFGLSVRCLLDGEVLLGTGGAVRRALPLLGEAFWVTYGDTLLAVPMADAEAVFRVSDLQGLMTVLRNQDRWDASNVRVAGGLVVEYRKGAPPGTFDHIDYGMSVLSARALSSFPDGQAFDLGEALRHMVAAGQLAAFEVTERFWEIGTEEGYLATAAHLGAKG